MFVYTIQPVVKPVWQRVWQPVVSCIQTFTRLSNPFDNRFDNRLYCVNGALGTTVYHWTVSKRNAFFSCIECHPAPLWRLSDFAGVIRVSRFTYLLIYTEILLCISQHWDKWCCTWTEWTASYLTSAPYSGSTRSALPRWELPTVISGSFGFETINRSKRLALISWSSLTTVLDESLWFFTKYHNLGQGQFGFV